MMFPENVFVDTSAWVALADNDDSNHKKAAAVYPSLLQNQKSLMTSNLVIAETYVLLLNELGHRAAIHFLEKIKASPRIVRIYSNDDIERDGEELLKKCDDQDFSYADAVSFVIMKRQEMRKAFCFDRHFATAGFEIIP
jgi:predicted nucleic acid-binding protein